MCQSVNDKLTRERDGEMNRDVIKQILQNVNRGIWVVGICVLTVYFCKLFLFEYLCNKNICEGKMNLELGCREAN